MTKKLTPRTIYIILIVIIIALSAGLVASQKALDKAQKELVYDNVQDWYEFRDLARNMHAGIYEPEDLSRIVVANHAFSLENHIRKLDGISMVGSLYYLCAGYHSRLIQGLCQHELSSVTFTEEEIELGFQYYMDMCQELEDLVWSIIQRCHHDDGSGGLSYGNLNWEFAEGLADPDSEIFKEVNDELNEYADKWTVIMKEFFKEEIRVIHD